MGSFEIKLPIKYKGENKGWVVSSATSHDIDETLLVATLFLNNSGYPYEVDVWKVDFSPTVELPENWEKEDFPRLPGSGTS